MSLPAHDTDPVRHDAGVLDLRSATRVTPNALAAFVMVAEERHYSRAAQRLQLDQSQVTRLIQQLEAQWQVRLFVRSTRTVQLSDEGARRLTAVRRVLVQLAAINNGRLEDALNA